MEILESFPSSWIITSLPTFSCLNSMIMILQPKNEPFTNGNYPFHCNIWVRATPPSPVPIPHFQMKLWIIDDRQLYFPLKQFSFYLHEHLNKIRWMERVWVMHTSFSLKMFCLNVLTESIAYSDYHMLTVQRYGRKHMLSKYVLFLFWNVLCS